MIRIPLFLLLFTGFCFGQRLFVYSPLTRIAPSGEVVTVDAGTEEPRHILSPGVPRNGFTPLRIVVELDKPEIYWLEIGQNPENAVAAKLYKENFVETPRGWIPDTLQEVSNPYRGSAADFRLPGQKVVTFWLEMGVAKDAPVDRIKVEPQLFVDSMKDWFVYPMEVRVQNPVLPASGRTVSVGELPAVTVSADAAGFGPLRTALCGTAMPPRSTGGQLTVREMLARYIAQDLGLVRSKTRLAEAFVKSSGVQDIQSWCAKPATPAIGPEWYLRLRDAIYREAGAQQ